MAEKSNEIPAAQTLLAELGVPGGTSRSPRSPPSPRRSAPPTAATVAATATTAVPPPSSIPPTESPIPIGIPTSPPSPASSAMSAPAMPAPGCCATPPRLPSMSRTWQSRQPRCRGHPRAPGDRDRLPLQPRRNLRRRSLACAVSASTSSTQTAPTLSARAATGPLSLASTVRSASWLFHNVEQPWHFSSLSRGLLCQCRND